MTHINYKNNQKLQVEFTKENLVEDSGMFLIKRFLEKQDLEHISKELGIISKRGGFAKLTKYFYHSINHIILVFKSLRIRNNFLHSRI